MATPSVSLGRQLVNPMFAPQANLFVGSIVVVAWRRPGVIAHNVSSKMTCFFIASPLRWRIVSKIPVRGEKKIEPVHSWNLPGGWGVRECWRGRGWDSKLDFGLRAGYGVPRNL